MTVISSEIVCKFCGKALCFGPHVYSEKGIACNVCSTYYHLGCVSKIESCLGCSSTEISTNNILSKTALLDAIYTRPHFVEMLDIARANAQGQQIWLVGGTIYRLALELLWGELTNTSDYDCDFLITQLASSLIIPDYCKTTWKDINDISDSSYSDKISYRLGKTEMGTWDAKHIFLDLINIHSINSSNTLDDYFNSVPFDIQAVALDLSSNIILGNKSLLAIQKRTIGINNAETALKAAERHGYSSLLSYARHKANQLNCDFEKTTIPVKKRKRKTNPVTFIKLNDI